MVFSLVSLLFVPCSFSQTDSVATPDTVVVLPDTVLPDTMVVAETLIIDTVVARPADPVKPIAKAYSKRSADDSENKDYSGGKGSAYLEMSHGRSRRPPRYG